MLRNSKFSLLTLIIFLLIIIICNKTQCEATGTQVSSFNQFSKAIEDNSFLIEEAFNQEERVVHNIQYATFYKKPCSLLYYSFNQEWPVGGIPHQFSFTVPYEQVNGLKGIGDISLNYRYQLTYKDDWALCAPRFSIIMPTGKKDPDLFTGNLGLQINVPATKRISELIQIHANLGFTYLNNASFRDESIFDNSKNIFSKSVYNFNTGVGLNIIATGYVNFIFEVIENFNNLPQNRTDNTYINETILVPGVRFAFNLWTAQIVPGIGIPFRYLSNSNSGYIGALAYFSVEFPY
ncbi:MAG: hypothetical protein NT007_12990 [Candidatus Kapabacteria bacterium]|nr:hypothetical protein [Candidatus Kapabacteria bacterium]